MREEEKNQSSQKVKNFFKKRWVFPALYLVIGALVISGIFFYQLTNLDVVPEEQAETGQDTGTNVGQSEEPSVEVNQAFENILMPVNDVDSVSVITEFFDANASAEDQEAALIVDGSTYRPSMGLDIQANDKTEFEVVAALSGTVTSVRQDALLGNVIEVDHGDGIATIYQSIKDIQVAEGDEVKQGEALATTSTSQLNKAAENHLHFEIRKDGIALNPLTYIGQPLTSVAEVNINELTEAADESAASEEDSAATEETTEDEATTEEPTEDSAATENEAADDSTAAEDEASEAETSNEESTDSAESSSSTGSSEAELQ